MTVVVTHRVQPEDVDEFLAWQERLRLAESKFDGFRGTELFRPIEGVQDEWTALYRYDTAADLDRWLTSDERQELLAEGEKFADFKFRTIDNSFGSWFAFDENGNEAPPPSDIKTSIAVWVGLYPTVVFLTLALSPLKMPLWLGMLVGNLCSSFAMSFLTMPYYVNPLLKRWLRPPAGCAAGRGRTGGASASSSRAQPVLDGGVLSGHQGLLAPALDAPLAHRRAARGPIAPGQRRQRRNQLRAPGSWRPGRAAPGCTCGPPDPPGASPADQQVGAAGGAGGRHRHAGVGAGERSERRDLGET